MYQPIISRHTGFSFSQDFHGTPAGNGLSTRPTTPATSATRKVTGNGTATPTASTSARSRSEAVPPTAATQTNQSLNFTLKALTRQSHRVYIIQKQSGFLNVSSPMISMCQIFSTMAQIFILFIPLVIIQRKIINLHQKIQLIFAKLSTCGKRKANCSGQKKNLL